MTFRDTAQRQVIPVDFAGELIAPAKGSFTDHSGTITASNSSQEIVAEELGRSYFIFFNLSASATIWLNFGAAASAGGGSIPIYPESGYEHTTAVSTQAINAYCASAGVPFTCKTMVI